MSSEKPLGRFPQPATKDSVAPKWPRAKGASAARVGLILLDSSLKPTYCNSEAFTIFAYPNQPAKTPNAEFSRSIRSIVGKKPGVDDFPTTTAHFVWGRRRYLGRTFVLEPESNGGSKPTAAITVERDSVPLDVVARFQLTDREIEAVMHLADGLTSKEIGQRINISPDTVETFFPLGLVTSAV